MVCIGYYDSCWRFEVRSANGSLSYTQAYNEGEETPLRIGRQKNKESSTNVAVRMCLVCFMSMSRVSAGVT